MSRTSCPHCKSPRLPMGRMAKQVVAVMSCPGCEELVVAFRDKVLPLDRRILERGTMAERKDHIAGIIAEFLEEGPWLLQGQGLDAALGDLSGSMHADEVEDGEEEAELELQDAENPITDTEFDKFVRIDLKCLDSDTYFRRHFD